MKSSRTKSMPQIRKPSKLNSRKLKDGLHPTLKLKLKLSKLNKKNLKEFSTQL